MRMRITLLMIMSFAGFEGVFAQSIFTNPITGTSPNTSNPYATGQTVAANMTVSGIGRGAGINGTNTNDRYNATSWSTSGIDLTDYFEFTLTPNSTYAINLVSFVYTGQSSITGPTSFSLRSSIDSYSSSIGTANETGTTISLSAVAYQNLASAITFRFYAWGGTGGTYSINDFTFNGTVVQTIISTQSGPWTTASTWAGGVVPTSAQNAVIAHNVTSGAMTRNSGTATIINSGANLAVSATYTNNGTTIVNGTFQIDQGGFGSGSGTWNYGGFSTLIFNHTSGVYGSIDAAHVYWPSSGPFNVTVANSGAGGINLGVARTINGVFSSSANIQNPGNLTLNGTFLLNAGYSFSGSGNPIYGNASLLRYNSGGSPGRNAEWTASSGTIGVTGGFPNNVQLSNNTTLNYPNTGTVTRAINSNLTIDSGSSLYMNFSGGSSGLVVGKDILINGNLTLGAVSGGDLTVGGNWTRGASGNFDPYGRAVFFNGTSTQTVTVTGGGTETFNFLVVQGSGTLQLATSGTGTNIFVNTVDGLSLSSSNATSTIDLNGKTLTLSGGGNLNLNAGTRRITSSVANGRLAFTGGLSITTTITNGGSLSSDTNTIVDLQAGLNSGGSSLFTINGTLQLNTNGFCVGNSPRYSTTSLLHYNSGTSPYNRQLEWTSAIAAIGTPGLPQNVQISNNTTLNYINVLNLGAKGILGNLTIDANSSLFMDFGNVTCAGALTVTGNLVSAGNLTLGFATGDDLRIGGDITFNTGYTFDAKRRAIFFTRNGIQTVSGTGGTPTFHYVLLTPSSGTTTVRLSGMNLNVTAPNGGNSIDFGAAANIFDINERTLTLGVAGQTNTINGTNGTFSGSLNSNLSLLGNSSIGILKFTTGFQTLGTLTINKVSGAVGATLGTNLDINTALVLNNGLIDLAGFNMTLSAAATIISTTTNFVIADGLGELRKTFTTTAAFTYPIGDSSLDYSPATLNFSSGIFTSAYVGLKVIDAKHPNNIATTDFLTRFWTVTSSGITSPNYSFTGTYISGSADVSGTEANSKPGRWDGTDWLDESLTSISANTLSLIGLTSLPTINQFSAGAPLSDANYYYRSNVNNGIWNTAASWQSSADGSTNWATATTPPSNRAMGILVRNGFNINADATRTVDDLTIEASATLTISSGTFTLNNGTASPDLIVNGTLTYSGGTLTQNASSGIAFAANATYNHTAASATLTLPIATWNISSNCNVTGLNNSSAITGGSTIGQTFGNFSFDNTNQTDYLNIENTNFRVNGTMTVGPNATTQKVSFSNSGSNSNIINRIIVSKGLLSVANSGNETLTVANDVAVTDGFFIVSMGSGTSNVDIGTDLSISRNGTVQVLGNASSPSQTLRIRRDLLIFGLNPQLILEAVSTSGSVATITVDRDFDCSSTGTTYNAVDFGTGSAAGNVINIGRNFTKSGNGSFFTTSNTSATGFALNGAGAQNFSYSGTNSNRTSYVVRNNSILLLNSNLTLGIGTNPPSSFTIDNGGTLNFQTNSIIAGNTNDPRFIASAGANLITSNTDGLGGTTATGSLRSFGSVNSAAGAGRAAFEAGHNLTFNAATTTPFASTSNLNFGTPATVNINAVITSNMTSNLIISAALNVNNAASFSLNPTNNNNLNLSGTAVVTISAGGVFDNGGENNIFSGGTINISGTFITRDVQGFVGTNTSIPNIVPVLNSGSTIEYGLAGSQAVQGATAPTYQNITFSNGGTKTLASNNAVIGTISVLGTTVFDAGNNAFGSGTSGITMTGTAKYMLAGTTASKPESGGSYSLGANTTFEFTGASETNIRISAPTITYANIIVNGDNVINPGTATGIRFQSTGTFLVKAGKTFKINNTNGFTGSTNTGINTVANGGPASITLETGSFLEYAGGNQIITPFNNTLTPFASYSNLIISGTGIKTISTSNEILVENELIVNNGTLRIDTQKLLTVRNAIKNNSTDPILVQNGGNLVQLTNVDNQTANDNVGNITMTRTSRSLDHDDYVYWGSPVVEDVFSQIPAAYDASYMWDLTGAEEGFWNGIGGTFPGRGFITRVGESGTGSQNFNFTGKANNGYVRVYGDNWNDGTGATGNTILLANPYPCAIDAQDFVSANSTINGTLYFWTAITAQVDGQYNTDDYATWNLTGSTAPNDVSGTSTLEPTGKIGSGQGFFAEMNADGNITFDNNMRIRTSNDNGQIFRTGVQEKSRIWLKLTNANNAFRQALIGYVDGATNNIDRLYDGTSFTSNEINLYSLSNDKKLVIQGRALPFVDTDLVPLGFLISTAGEYTIAIDKLDGLFAENQNIYLEDLLLNTIHDLKAASYTFATDAGTFENRFVLRYNNGILAVDPIILNENKVSVATEKQQLKIKSYQENLQKVVVYDLLGRKIFEKDGLNTSEFYADDIILNQQTLIVKITLISGVTVTKKIIQ